MSDTDTDGTPSESTEEEPSTADECDESLVDEESDGEDFSPPESETDEDGESDESTDGDESDESDESTDDESDESTDDESDESTDGDESDESVEATDDESTDDDESDEDDDRDKKRKSLADRLRKISSNTSSSPDKTSASKSSSSSSPSPKETDTADDSDADDENDEIVETPDKTPVEGDSVEADESVEAADTQATPPPEAETAPMEAQYAKTDRVSTSTLPFEVVKEADLDEDTPELDDEPQRRIDAELLDAADYHPDDDGDPEVAAATQRSSPPETMPEPDFTSEQTEITAPLDEETDEMSSSVLAADRKSSSADQPAAPVEKPPEFNTTSSGAETFDEVPKQIQPGRVSRPSPADLPSYPPGRPPAPEHHANPDLAPSGLESPPADEADKDTSEPEEFASDNTQLFQSRYENEPITPRLSTLEGPATGQEFLIHRMRNSVGRSTKNTITVPDLSMSRKHFEVLQKPDESFAIRDLMAVNTTSLNGVAIKEADLFHGDRIEAGHSVFQFLIPGEAPVGQRQRNLVPAASTKTVTEGSADDLGGPAAKDQTSADNNSLDRLLLAITIAAGVLSIPLLAFLLYAVVLDDEPPPSAYDLYFSGVEAFQNQNWDRATELFEQSHQADPTFGEVNDQLARIEEERQAQQLVNEMRTEMAEELDQDRLDQLRAISHDSSYYEEAQSVLTLAKHEETRLLFERAQSSFDAGELEKSAEKLTELRAVVPQHEGAKDLEEELKQALAAASEEEDNGDADTEEKPEATARPSPPPAAAAPEKEDTDDGLLGDPFAGLSSGSRSDGDGSQQRGQAINFTDGFSHYRAERFDEAIDHFETIADSASGTLAARARRTADDIETFQRSLATGRQQLESAQYASASEHFERARQADQAVARSFGDEVAAYLASSLAHRGQEELENENYRAASSLLQRARAHDASHPDVESLSHKLNREASALYNRAAEIRKSDPEGAAELCRTVVTMVPPESEPHQRARQLLGTLQ